jgi:NAD(P)-dependent dehydrogenase (short-subunit alcohol dehydrogenase family)
MSLVNQTAWVVGGVGVVGRGITRGLLQAGATVIVNSRSEERLATIQETLGNPERLIAVHGSLLPGSASKTVADTLSKHGSLSHVVAHGAVRWWARPTAGKYEYYEYRAGCDESYALNIRASERLLSMSPEEFASSSAQLATLHFSAAQQLMPRLQPAAAGKAPSYTFVTGDGSGKPGGERTAMGEINSHHVWGLSAALRKEMEGQLLNVREIRVGLPVHAEDRDAERPLSEDIGDLCAGLAAAASNQYDHGRLIKLDDFEELHHMLHEYRVTGDGRIGSLPRYLCDQGELSGSL